MDHVYQKRSRYALAGADEIAFSRLANSIAARLCLALLLCISFAAPVQGQQSGELIAAQIEAGEFASAIESASQLPADEADLWMSKISQSQISVGAIDGAFKSVATIRNDQQRAQTLSSISSFENPRTFADSSGTGGGLSGGSGSGLPGSGNPGGGSNAGGNNSGGNNFGGAQGGITINDFQPLMQLIQQTIAPESWSDSNGEGTLSPYPSGVYVDGSGLMQRIESRRPSRLASARAGIRTDSGNRRWQLPTDMRKISLNRLEKAAQIADARGEQISDEMANMAGMYEVRYLMYVPETNDIVIAGPAGPWEIDADGRKLNTRTGKPVLQLDDLVVCLRNATESNGTFGCSINPREANLTETKEFIESSDLKGKQWRNGLRDALGRQDVEVFGIDPRTHAGYVLVEADYRMKLVGMGLEPSIAEIPSYLERVEVDADGNVPPMDVVRWWFTLNYDDVAADENREVFEFTGSGVKVLSENEMLDQQGQRVHTGQTFGATRDFAKDFTEHFDKISQTYPVYRQLKNVFDMAIVSSLIEGQGLAAQAEWNLTYFGTDTSSGRVYQPAKQRTPEEVESVLNHRMIEQRKENSTVRHTIVGVSGGVVFTAADVTEESKIRTNVELESTANEISPAISATPVESLTWWWD